MTLQISSYIKKVILLGCRLCVGNTVSSVVHHDMTKRKRKKSDSNRRWEIKDKGEEKRAYEREGWGAREKDY